MNINTNVVSIDWMNERKSELNRRVGSLLNRIETSIEDLKRFRDISGVEQTIQSLSSLRSQLCEKYDDYRDWEIQ